MNNFKKIKVEIEKEQKIFKDLISNNFEDNNVNYFIIETLLIKNNNLTHEDCIEIKNLINEGIISQKNIKKIILNIPKLKENLFFMNFTKPFLINKNYHYQDIKNRRNSCFIPDCLEPIRRYTNISNY